MHAGMFFRPGVVAFLADPSIRAASPASQKNLRRIDLLEEKNSAHAARFNVIVQQFSTSSRTGSATRRRKDSMRRPQRPRLIADERVPLLNH